MGNAAGEIEIGLKNDDSMLIGYRLVNKDLQQSKQAFVAIMEALYAKELANVKPFTKDVNSQPEE